MSQSFKCFQVFLCLKCFNFYIFWCCFLEGKILLQIQKIPALPLVKTAIVPHIPVWHPTQQVNGVNRDLIVVLTVQKFTIVHLTQLFSLPDHQAHHHNLPLSHQNHEFGHWRIWLAKKVMVLRNQQHPPFIQQRRVD